MATALALNAQQRLARIAHARNALLDGRAGPQGLGLDSADQMWIERSWRRCLDQGRRPGERIGFDCVPAPALRRIEESNHALLQAARPVLHGLARAIAHCRYFALLTDAHGVVIEAHGAIDRSDRRARVIARVGVDLSERSIGTTAIGTALAEQQAVWLHRGEHFFDATACYSCAGAPVFSPLGDCIGMLDLTGIDAEERPELRHLAAQAARDIENALLVATPAALHLRLNWQGHGLGGDGDGLLGIDSDGRVLGANRAARALLPGLGRGAHTGSSAADAAIHLEDLFAMPAHALLGLRPGAPLEAPLWSGLRLLVARHEGHPPQGKDPSARAATSAAAPAALSAASAGPAIATPLGAPAQPLPLKALETALIRQAVADARGNVQAAAKALGVSRATVYRHLARKMSA